MQYQSHTYILLCDQKRELRSGNRLLLLSGDLLLGAVRSNEKTGAVQVAVSVGLDDPRPL